MIWKYHRKTHRAAAVHNNPVGYIATILLPSVKGACCKKQNKKKQKTTYLYLVKRSTGEKKLFEDKSGKVFTYVQ